MHSVWMVGGGSPGRCPVPEGMNRISALIKEPHRAPREEGFRDEQVPSMNQKVGSHQTLDLSEP